MREGTATLGRALASSHEVTASVSVFHNGEVLLEDVPLADGTLSVDSDSSVPGSLSASVPRYFTDPAGAVHDLLPVGAKSPFSSDGQQVAVSYQVGYPGYGTEIVGLGYYRIAEWEEGDDGTISFTADSLEALLAEARFLNPANVKAGTTFAAAALALVDDLLPVEITASTTAVSGGQTVEDERLDALTDLCTAWPARMHVDDTGLLVFAPALDDTTDPVAFTLTDGENGTTVQVPRSGSRDGIYNAVKASGEASGDVAPVSAVVYLTTGPRRWNGPFGNVPYFWSSPLLTTVAQARTAARTRLRSLQNLAATVEVTAAPDPRIQVGDLGELTWRGETALVRVDAVTLPLTAAGGAMTIRCHEVTR